MIANHAAKAGKGYPNLDIAKFVMALFVILIHARPFAGIAPTADFLVSDVAARVAVPVFFAISGFLFFGKLEYAQGKVKWCAANRNRLLRFLKRNMTIYLVWSVVYILSRLPQWYAVGWWGTPLVKDCAVNLVFSGSEYHTWFLLAIIYAVPLLFGLLTVCPKKKLPLIIAAGWCMECLVYSYDWLIPQHPQLVQWLLDRVPIAFDTVLRALPLLGVGALLADRTTDHSEKADGILCACALAACAVEATALKLFSPNQTNFSYLIMTPLMAWYVLRCFLTERQSTISPAASAVLREASLTIYCLHPLVIRLLEYFGMDSGPWRSLAVMVISVAAAVSWSGLRSGRRIKKR